MLDQYFICPTWNAVAVTYCTVLIKSAEKLQRCPSVPHKCVFLFLSCDYHSAT